MANFDDIDRWSQSLRGQADAAPQPQPQPQPGPRNPGMANPQAQAAYAEMERTRAQVQAQTQAPHVTESPCAVPSRPRQPCSKYARIFLQMFG